MAENTAGLQSMRGKPNQLVVGNAGIASRLTIGRHWSGVSEPGR